MASKDAKCILQVQFDRADRVYRPGERITGTLEILPGKQCHCRRITLVTRWVARGVGPEDTARDEALELPGGVWRDNEKITHNFDLPAPAGPLSYQGDSFEISWLLEVNADLAMTVDVSAVERFTLVHGKPESTGPSFGLSDAYNPFAALGPEVTSTTGARDRPPAFYAALGIAPRIIALPMVGALLGYFIGMRQEYFQEGYEAPIIWGLIILFGSFALTGRFRRKMREKKREAQNRQVVRALAKGENLPRLPGKYWQKTGPDESQRGWPRSIGALSRGAIGLFLMTVSLAVLLLGDWGEGSWAYLVLFILSVLIVGRAVRPCIRSWKFIRAALTLGHVEIGILPHNIRIGDEAYVSLDFRPAKSVQISKATATLVAYEVADQFYRFYRPADAGQIVERVQASQAQTKAHRFLRARMACRHGLKFAEGRSLLPQESAGLSGTIAIPTDSPPTFLGQDHKILWFLAVRIALSDGLQWSKDVPVYLRS